MPPSLSPKNTKPALLAEQVISFVFNSSAGITSFVKKENLFHVSIFVYGKAYTSHAIVKSLLHAQTATTFENEQDGHGSHSRSDGIETEEDDLDYC